MAELAAGLGAHLHHEETHALPLVRRVLTPRGWEAFAREQRGSVGLRGAADVFPWLLDGAPEATRREVLARVPAPVRLAYRLVWRPRYVRRTSWRRRTVSS